jgi:hypothetical protein
MPETTADFFQIGSFSLTAQSLSQPAAEINAEKYLGLAFNTVYKSLYEGQTRDFSKRDSGL